MTADHSKRPTRTPKAASNLAKGFDSLTLDPSPRLRRARQTAAKHNPMAQAWIIVGRAMFKSVKSVREVILPTR